jgi:GNAT superfamily N-acetyltransferase
MRLRRLEAEDSFEELTGLLHRAYASHAAAGRRFSATFQAAAVTKKRALQGECWAGEEEGRIVATVTFYPPELCKGASWYDRADVAKFGQMAVEPERKGAGLGRILLDHVEDRARACGAKELALDTTESAEELIAIYTRRGFRFIEYVDWRPTTNYRSVLMSKTL